MHFSWNLDMSPPQHWHGLFQSRTNWADGVDAVTQCPIIPDESFLYNFTVPDQSVFLLAMFVRCRQAHFQAFQGTFWYHSHFQAQYCDGLRGALIIDDPDDPQESLYDVDNGEKDF
jgi:iron transport multicopper oxidase